MVTFNSHVWLTKDIRYIESNIAIITIPVIQFETLVISKLYVVSENDFQGGLNVDLFLAT